MTFAARGARDGFEEFTINGIAFSMDQMKPLFNLRLGKRYRLHMRNATDAALLTTSAWQALAAQALTAGLTRFLVGG